MRENKDLSATPASLRGLHKVELHRHLEGCVRYGTYRELAVEAGLAPLPRHKVRFSRRDRRDLKTFLTKFPPHW